MRIIFLTVIVLWIALVNVGHSVQDDQPFIRAIDEHSGFEFKLSGNSGLFIQGENRWHLEYIQRSAGLNGMFHTLAFLGRNDENFIYLHLFVNSSGDGFWAHIFDYKSGTAQWGEFHGGYSIIGLQSNPTTIENFVPRGKIPNFEGRQFEAVLGETTIKHNGGSLKELGDVCANCTIEVYPVLEVPVSGTWIEFWAIGYDRERDATYLLLFYTISPNVTVVDLSTATISTFEFTASVVTGHSIKINHEMEL